MFTFNYIELFIDGFFPLENTFYLQFVVMCVEILINYESQIGWGF